MGNLTIKPNTGGLLKLQDEGGTDAISISTTGNTTLAGTANALGTVTSGTLGSAVNLNHDAKKNSWHIFRNGSVNYTSSSVIDFANNVFIGSNVTEAGGRITVTTAGLYLIMCSVSRQASEASTITFDLRVDGTVVNGTKLYLAGTPGVTYAGKSGAWVVPLNASQIVDIYGTGYIYGHNTVSMTYFSGTRIGAIS